MNNNDVKKIMMAGGLMVLSLSPSFCDGKTCLPIKSPDLPTPATPATVASTLLNQPPPLQPIPSGAFSNFLAFPFPKTLPAVF
jgi:hypothetical protein